MNTNSLFDKSYIVFGNVYNNTSIKDDFKVGIEYQIIMLHDIEKTIPDNLLAIILNQINSKIKSIKSLTSISCPIASASVRTNIENNFIKDYVRELFLLYNKTVQPDKFKELLSSIFINYNPATNYTTSQLVEDLLNNQDYEKIKKLLGFKIQLYKPGNYCPVMLVKFNSSNLVNHTHGIFNLDQQINSDSKSIVNFDNDSNYLLDQTKIKPDSTNKIFFETIKPTIPSGILVVINSNKMKYQTKYQINYD